jgi:hypothetical protein
VAVQDTNRGILFYVDLEGGVLTNLMESRAATLPCRTVTRRPSCRVYGLDRKCECLAGTGTVIASQARAAIGEGEALYC